MKCGVANSGAKPSATLHAYKHIHARADMVAIDVVTTVVIDMLSFDSMIKIFKNQTIGTHSNNWKPSVFPQRPTLQKGHHLPQNCNS